MKKTYKVALCGKCRRLVNIKHSGLCSTCSQHRYRHPCLDCGSPTYKTRCRHCANVAKNPGITPWTPQASASVIELYRGGMTLRAIARKLDLTIGQVIGRLYRSGMCRPKGEYAGPTSMERLQSFHDTMDAVMLDYERKQALGLIRRSPTAFEENTWVRL